MQGLPRKICWREIRAIKRRCICFVYPVMLRITVEWTYLMLVFVKNNLTKFSQNFSIGLWMCWSVLFVQLRLELPSNEHIPCLTSLPVELIVLNCCWMSALALKNLLEGNPSDQLQEKLQLFSLCSYVEYSCVINIFHGRLLENNLANMWLKTQILTLNLFRWKQIKCNDER